MRTLQILMPIAVLGCAGPAPEDAPTAPPTATAATLDRHRLLEDVELEGDQDVRASQIQRLLEEEGSALADFVENGRTAAQWIVQESIAQHISPVYMLARIEGESGLVRSGTLDSLLHATGCACPDGQACDPSVAEFGLQVRCAAELARSYLDDLDAFNSTISGWGVGRAKWTLDPCHVVPDNRATAALYTYTPWVGAYTNGCGTAEWGGSSLMALLTRELAAALPAAAADCPYGNGLYCGGNGIAGDPDLLYTCTDGSTTIAEACSSGCSAKPPGFDDACL